MSIHARRNATTALLAGVLAVLVMSTPVAAEHTTILASQHTSDADFNTAATLDNVSVASGDVYLQPESATIDSFEWNNIANYTGDTSDYSTTNLGTSTNGTYFLQSDSASPGRIISTNGLPRYYDGDGNITVDIQLGASDHAATVGFGASDLDNYVGVRINSTGAQAITRDSGTGGSLLIVDSTTASIPHDEYVTLRMDLRPADDELRTVIVDASGTTVLSTRFDVILNEDGVGHVFNANQSGVQFDNVTDGGFAGTKRTQGTYISQNHTVDDAVEGYTNLTLTNAEAQVTWQGSNGDTWTDLASATYTSTGNRTLDVASGYSDYRVNVTFVRQSGDTTARLHDEGVFRENFAPEINTSSLSPADDASLNTQSVTLEGEVRDANFVDGETVEVNFTVNGSVVDTQTISSNQTVSTTVSVGTGEHTWSLSAEDSSHTTDTVTRTFYTPGIIRVYDGDDPTTLLDHQTIDTEFIGTADTSNFQESRATNNGTFPLGGLPAEELRVRLNATDYGERVLILESPSEERETIMYNLSAASTFEQCFQLDSRGAGFAPDETKLIIQAYINGQWQDATGKYFGAANLACAYLEDGENYRLKVTDGDQTRNLGGYEADQSFESEVITLVVEGVTFGLDRGEDYRWQAELTNESGSPEILFKLDSRDQDLEDLEITIWERGDPSTVLDTVQETGSVGVYSASFPLTDSEADQEWVVNWTAEYPDGTIATGQTIVSLATAQSTLVPAGAPSDVILGLVVGLVILLAMVFGGELTAPVGMVIVAAFAGLLALLGVLDIPENVLMLAIGLAVVGYVGIGVFSR